MGKKDRAQARKLRRKLRKAIREAKRLAKRIKVTPTTGLTAPPPGAVLNIGFGPNQNHFVAQIARTNASDYTTVSVNDIANGVDENPYLHTVKGNDGINRVQFQTQLDAPTTSGSTYPRSELRELNADGSNVAFDVSTGTHTLHGRTRITHLPPNKPEVVIAQLHNGNADRIAIRTQVISGTNMLVVRVNGSAVSTRLMNPFVLGQEFEWMIKVVNGIGYIYFNDMNTPIITTVQMTPTAGVSTWYFKAGCYAQSNPSTDSATEYVSVELRDLSVFHNA